MSEFFPTAKRSAYSGSFRAVGWNGSNGMRRVSIVRLDRVDDEIECIGPVDLPGHAVLAWRNGLEFGEVIAPVNAPRRVSSHDEHNTKAAFGPREQ